MKVIVFGSTGGIGLELCNLVRGKIDLVEVSKKDIDFLNEEDYKKIHDVLDKEDPDFIVNCSGIFGDNDASFDDIFKVNLKSNWALLEHYRKNLPNKSVRIIMLGSSSHSEPRKDYALYAASKSALFNMFESYSEIFEGTNVLLGIANPRKTYTNMIKHLASVSETNSLDPKYVANHLINFFLSIKKNSYIDIK